jgi:hypothetical protein
MSEKRNRVVNISYQKAEKEDGRRANKLKFWPFCPTNQPHSVGRRCVGTPPDWWRALILKGEKRTDLVGAELRRPDRVRR